MAKAGEHLTVPCEQCSSPYRQTRADQRFCSGACSSKAWRQRRVGLVKCPLCGMEFPAFGPRRYCTQQCQATAEAARRRRIGGPGKGWSKGKRFADLGQTCENCGDRFHAPPSQVLRGGGKFCSTDCRAQFMGTHPEFFPQTRTRRGSGGRRPDLNNRYFRSAWEANYARYLNLRVSWGTYERWEYEPDTFEFPIKRGARFYTPDFKVWKPDGTFVYHEVKGYMDDRSRVKLDRMRRYFPRVPLVLVDKDAYYKIGGLASLIPEWEGRRR